MTQESMASMARSAAIAGRGTGIGVYDNVWSRELTEDGRVYYYNRATGNSQWHLPNDKYQSQSSIVSREDSQVSAQGIVVWPTHAKATLKVDCVTEVLPEHGLDSVGPSVGAVSVTNVIGAIRAEPRSWVKIRGNLPVYLGNFLDGTDFELLCVKGFKAVVTQGELMLHNNFDTVTSIVMLVDADPPLRLTEERFMQLLDDFDPSGTGAVDTQDFVAFMQFAVAVRYLEQVSGTV
jgi:hypothetical protein